MHTSPNAAWSSSLNSSGSAAIQLNMKKPYPEEVDEALLVFGQQFSCHAHIQEYEFRGGLDVEIIGYATPQAVGISHPHQDVARVQICICTDAGDSMSIMLMYKKTDLLP